MIALRQNVHAFIGDDGKLPVLVRDGKAHQPLTNERCVDALSGL